MTALISILNFKLLERLFSRWVALLLRLRGVKVGQNFTARALPILVKDSHSTIQIGDNVILKDRVDIRSLKGAEVYLKNGVRLDRDVRIVATNAAKVTFDLNSDIGCNSIFNCGADVYIGKDVLVAGFCYVQTSAHKTALGSAIQTQGYDHKPITIGADCWLGAGSFVLPGVILSDGVVVGANSLVNNDVPKNTIVAGSPAKKIAERI